MTLVVIWELQQSSMLILGIGYLVRRVGVIDFGPIVDWWYECVVALFANRAAMK